MGAGVGERDNTFDRATRPSSSQQGDDNPAVADQLLRAAAVGNAPGAAAGHAPGQTPAQGPAPPTGRAAHTLDRGLFEGRQSLQLIALVRSALAPAYRRAVDALDPAAALELARHVVGTIRVAEAGKQEVHACLPVDDPHHYMVSIAGQPNAMIPRRESTAHRRSTTARRCRSSRSCAPPRRARAGR